LVAPFNLQSLLSCASIAGLEYKSNTAADDRSSQTRWPLHAWLRQGLAAGTIPRQYTRPPPRRTTTCCALALARIEFQARNGRIPNVKATQPTIAIDLAVHSLLPISAEGGRIHTCERALQAARPFDLLKIQTSTSVRSRRPTHISKLASKAHLVAPEFAENKKTSPCY